MRGRVLNLEPYFQTHSTSCLAASALMILHYYYPKKWLLNHSNEMLLHNMIKYSDDLDFGCYSKLAYYLSLIGFSVNVVIGELVDDGSNEYKIWYDNYEKSKNLVDYIFLGNSDLKEKLESIIYTQINKGIPLIIYLHRAFHNVVIKGYQNEVIFCNDPINGESYCSLNNLYLQALNPWGLGLLYFFPKKVEVIK